LEQLLTTGMHTQRSWIRGRSWFHVARRAKCQGPRRGSLGQRAVEREGVSRIEFSAATKRLLADRVGHECSFPMCTRRTIGPGPGTGTTAGSGVAAHIHSAAPGGPRGRGGLTDEELRAPENGLWLCADHARLVDTNQGRGYPAPTLRSFKALQEARVVRELQGLYSPLAWIHRLSFKANPLFMPGQTVHLGKLNLIVGDNGTGKTALTEWVAGAFDSAHLARWRTQDSVRVHYQVTYLNPSPVLIDMRIGGDQLPAYEIDGRSVPFNPLNLRIIRLTELRFRDGPDDIGMLAHALGLHRHEIPNLAREVDSAPHASVHNLRLVDDGERSRLHANLDGTAPNLPLGALGRREKERVFVEFATAAARAAGKYAPALLILDGCPAHVDEGTLDRYAQQLLHPENQFQTILCVPHCEVDIDSLQWRGWEVLQTSRTPPHVQLTQEPRPERASGKAP